jgi:hypothetical protein
VQSIKLEECPEIPLDLQLSSAERLSYWRVQAQIAALALQWLSSGD